MSDRTETGIVEPSAGATPSAPSLAKRTSPYAYYALALLTLANFFNYIDRNIVSIIGQRIKADLSLSDAQLGFLLGTAFAVFYGVVGVAMGRIADALRRTRLMAVGLVLWSAMTALGAFAGNFWGFATARLGVGIGEATANPCSHSLLSDYFPARNRAAVIATYVLGTHLGLAFALAGGGLVLQHWSHLCLSLPVGACRLTDWRAVLLVMGLPGLLIVVPIALLREPGPKRRPASVTRVVTTEMSAALPPFTLLALGRAGGRGAVARNLLFAGGLAAVVAAISGVVGDWPQWAAVALGTYSVVTWATVLRRRDLPLYQMTFGSPIFRMVAAGAGLTACLLGAVQAWSAPYAIRFLAASPGKAGVALGLTSAATAGTSVLIGGFVADIWKRHDRRAPIWIVLIGLLAPLPAFVVMLQAKSLATFVTAYGVFMLLAMLWAGPIGALVQDIVLPRMRGTAASAFALVAILVGSGLGPYWVGKISTMTGSLAVGLYSILALAPPAALFLLAAARRLRDETDEQRYQRARDAGEPI